MIINISLVIVFLCLSFVTMSKRIEMKWFAKLVMCFMLISIVGVGASLNSEYKRYEDLSWDMFFSSLAFMVCFVTYWTNKRGGYR